VTWPTPNVPDRGPELDKSHRRESGGVDLQSAVQLWPTPGNNEWKGTGPEGSKSHQHMLDRKYLCAAVTDGPPRPDSPSTNGKSRELLWRSPSVQEPGVKAERLEGEVGSRMYDKETGRPAQHGLTQQVAKQFRTPSVPNGGRQRKAKVRESGARSLELNEQLQGKLNPAWVEQLMGLPAGWTD
jgi:hypothetical protein